MSVAGHILGSIVSIGALLSVLVGVIAGCRMEYRADPEDTEAP